MKKVIAIFVALGFGLATHPIIISSVETLPLVSQMPSVWGSHIPGTVNHLNTSSKVIALTFDACDGVGSASFDQKLINYLKAEQIPATLFISGKWIAGHPGAVQKLAQEPLFDIENHGSDHRPCSASGHTQFGLVGTADIASIKHEIADNANTLEKLIGRKPLWYRSGTDYYDEACIQTAHELGYQVASYNHAGDEGATASAEKVKLNLLSAQPGDIYIFHMNKPAHDTAEGIMAAIPELKAAGWQFTTLASIRF